MQLTANELLLISALRNINEWVSITAADTSSDKFAHARQVYRQVDEELNGDGELHMSLHAENDLGVLDGICDVLYTALQLIKAGEAAGYDVMGALSAVCANNATKIPDDTPDNSIRFLYSVEAYNEADPTNPVKINSKAGKIYLMDSNGKIRKPLGYKSVELHKYLNYNKGE